MDKIKNVSIEWCLEKLESLKECNLNPEKCTHDTTPTGEIQPFDYASIDMALSEVIGELKRLLEYQIPDTDRIMGPSDVIKV